MSGISARQTAVFILNRTDLQKGQLSGILKDNITKTEQRAFCNEIVNGTVRNLTAIDLIICKLAQLHLNKINKQLINILRCAVYEILFCQTADYAVVNEYVQIAKNKTGQKGAGFVNAVLRNILRHRQNSADIDFDTAIFADKNEHPNLYLSQRFSIPKWLIDGWVNNYGLSAAENICRSSNRRPDIFVYPNYAKTDIENLCSLFNCNQIGYEKTVNALKLKNPSAIDKIAGYQQGIFYIQDITAAKVVESMNLAGSEIALDLCSAPGGKTIGLSAKAATVFATDFDNQRLQKVRQNCSRLGLKNVDIIEYRCLDDFEKVDVVLADVPCSNTGVLAKRADARWRLKKDSINKITTLQFEIITKASILVKDGGILCYSTCSIEKQENQDIVENFLQENCQFQLVKQELTLPNNDCDGGYFAIMKK